MKILSVSAQIIPACCMFEVNGFDISFSTISRIPSLAVFDSNGNEVMEKVFQERNPMATADNLVKAIQWCKAQ